MRVVRKIQGVLDSVTLGIDVLGHCCGLSIRWLVDTGASTSLMARAVWQRLRGNRSLNPTEARMTAADGRDMVVYGSAELKVDFGGCELPLRVMVVDMQPEAVIGMDALCRWSAIVNTQRRQIEVEDGAFPVAERPAQQVHLVHEDDAEDGKRLKKGDQVWELEERQTLGEEGRGMVVESILVPASASDAKAPEGVTGTRQECPELEGKQTSQEGAEGHATVEKSVLVPILACGAEASSRVPLPSRQVLTVVEGHMESEASGNTAESCVATLSRDFRVPGQSAVQLPVDLEGGTDHSRWILEGSDKFEERTGLRTGRVCVLAGQGSAVLEATNSGPGEVCLFRGTKIATGTPIVDVNTPQVCRMVRQIVEEEIQKMLDKGVIEPGGGPWASPIVLVKKKSGEWRFCIDYRKLNEVTKKDAYPLPRIDDTLDMLSGAKYFSTLDLASGYWQVAMDESDREKTAVCTHQGLYQFKRMPFGLCNAPSTFERLMDVVLKGLVGLRCLVYLDDVIVFGECCDRLEEVLQRLEGAGLKIKGSKCQLFQPEVEYLGHVVSAEGVARDPKKVEAVQCWPTPRCVKDIRSFLGLCSYYRNFIKGFSQVAAPMNQLLEKETEFVWAEECEVAFEHLKQALTSAPILGYPRPGGQLVVDTDASDVGLGAVLSQVQDGEERVLCYASRSLLRPEKNYCVTRRELLAVLFAVRKFKAYLGGEVRLRTDHHALMWLLNFKEPEGQVARWLEELGAYNLRIEHRPGKKHGNADALSRQECKQCGRLEEQSNMEKEHHMVRVMMLNPQEATTTLEEAQRQDPTAQELRQAIEDGREVEEARIAGPGDGPRLRREFHRLQLRQGLLGRDFVTTEGGLRWQVYVPSNSRRGIFQEVHAGVVGGHLGLEKTLSRIQERFFWPGMTKDAKLWCETCERCQKRKPPPKKKRAQMQVVVAEEPFARVAMDMMGPLPRTTRGNRYILVIADYFSKWVEAFPMKNGEAETVARLLVCEVICRFGTPRVLHSDHGRNFEAGVIQELCRMLGIKKTRTTPYHPQADGMVERFNRTLEAMLSTVVEEDQSDWDEQIPFVLAAYRASSHASTGFSPNFLMMGREVTLPVKVMYGRTPGLTEENQRGEAAYAADVRERLREAHRVAYERMGRMAERQKRYRDDGVAHITYPVGSLVWMFHPMPRQGLTPKLRNFWTGPWEVEEQLSDVVYRIRDGRKRRVVHADLLKLARIEAGARHEGDG